MQPPRFATHVCSRGRRLALALPLLLASAGVAAQDGNTTEEKYKDWTVQCGVQSQDNNAKRCLMRQVVTYKQEGQDKASPLLLVLVVRSEDKQQARLIFKLPLYSLLPAGVSFRIDKGKEIKAPYRFCDPEGCSVILDMTKSLENAFKRGSRGQLQFTSTLGGKAEVPVSLSGFTSAFNRLGKI